MRHADLETLDASAIRWVPAVTAPVSLADWPLGPA